jgi:hypothetical protein
MAVPIQVGNPTTIHTTTTVVVVRALSAAAASVSVELKRGTAELMVDEKVELGGGVMVTVSHKIVVSISLPDVVSRVVTNSCSVVQGLSGKHVLSCSIYIQTLHFDPRYTKPVLDREWKNICMQKSATAKCINTVKDIIMDVHLCS